MNIKEYISTGMLEMYALGVCSESERKEVELLLSKHPELHTELMRIESTLEEYAQIHAVAPSSRVKDSLMAKIDFSSTDTRSISSKTDGKVVKRDFSMYKWLAAASIVILIGSVAVNFVLYNRYSQTKEQLTAFQQDNSRMAEDLNLTKAGLNDIQRNMAMVNDPSTIVVRMQGLPISPDSKATIYWNKESTDVLLSVNSLPTPPQGKQYQLWAIVNGAPVDGGVFDMKTSEELQSMKSFTDASAFAVTLEPMGGSVSPSLDQMVVMAGI